MNDPYNGFLPIIFIPCATLSTRSFRLLHIFDILILPHSHSVTLSCFQHFLTQTFLCRTIQLPLQLSISVNHNQCSDITLIVIIRNKPFLNLNSPLSSAMSYIRSHLQANPPKFVSLNTSSKLPSLNTLDNCIFSQHFLVEILPPHKNSSHNTPVFQLFDIQLPSEFQIKVC